MGTLEIRNLDMSYGKHTVLSGLSLTLQAGECTCILGANGSGKSTLIKSILQTLPHRGSCVYQTKEASFVLEKSAPKERGHLLSYLPQKSGITLSLSALDVVLMGYNPSLGLLQYPTAAMKENAMKTLDFVGLKAQSDQDFLTLSEGQKQLCLLARALVQDSSITLLDEPEAALDFEHKHHILSLVAKLVHTREKCCLLSIHDPSLALQYSDKIVLLQDGHITDTLYPKKDSKEVLEHALHKLYPHTILTYHQVGEQCIPVLLPRL